MGRFGPRHYMAPAAAFTMAVVLGLYIRSSIRQARWDAKWERSQKQKEFDQRQLERAAAARSHPESHN